MWSLFLAALNGFIRNKPCITATPAIASSRVRPPSDISFILVWNSYGESIELNASGLREVKNVFMTVVKKPF
jgi:hypothetical protein